MRKHIALTLLTLVGILPANAQYTFTLNVSWSGNCSGYTAQMNQAIRGFQTQTINGFPTRELCEQTRAMCHQELGHIEIIYYDVKTGKEIKREATNCKLNVTTTPCTGRPMAGTVGTLNALGVSQGTSFYSANSANEIQNWSNDDMERMLALDKNFNSFETLNVSTRDDSYDYLRNNLLSGRMPDGTTKYIKNADLLRVVGQANRTPGTFTLSSDMMPITMTQPESGVYVPPIHDAYAELLKKEEERRQRELEWEQKEAKVWDEIKTKLDDENFHLLAYILQYNNGGERPKFLGITESGRYIFESKDGNNVFSVSKDANDIQTLTFEEHSWSDDNIIKAIQEKGFKDVIDERFEFEIKGGKLDFLDAKDGKISFKDLEDLSPDKIRKLLPYIEGEIKLKLFDNSSELSYSYMHLFDSHISLGGNATLSSGGKDNISASLSLSAEGDKNEIGSNGNAYYSGSTSTQKEGWSYGPIKIKGNAKAEIELTTGKIEGAAGYVQKVGGKYIYCYGGAELKGGTRISKSLLKSPWGIFYAKGKIGGLQCKNITNYSGNIPTQIK